MTSVLALVISIAIVLATIVSYAIGWALFVPFLVPLLNTAASFPFMIFALKRGNVRLAVVRMLIWALTLGVCSTLLSYARPQETGQLWLHAFTYRTEMFAWVMTGQGAESHPSQFIPYHVRDAAIFVVLALATGGTVAMMMGAALMNYMGYYVGALAAHSARPVLTMLLAWHPWSVIRVISYVALGTILSMPALSRVMRFRVDWPAARPFLVWSCAGLVADVVLKALLAPTWQRLLLRTVGW